MNSYDIDHVDYRGVMINKKIVSRVLMIHVLYHGCLNQYKRYLILWQKSQWKSHKNWLWVQYKYIEASIQ